MQEEWTISYKQMSSTCFGIVPRCPCNEDEIFVEHTSGNVSDVAYHTGPILEALKQRH